VRELPKDSYRKKTEESLISIKTFYSRQEAENAAAFLRGKEIFAVVSADDAGGARPHLAFTQGANLLVRKEDLEKARKIIK